MMPMCPSNGFGTVKIVSTGRGSGLAQHEAAEPVESLARGRGERRALVASLPAVLPVLEPELAALDGESLEKPRQALRAVHAMPRREDGVAADGDREEHETAGPEEPAQARHRGQVAVGMPFRHAVTAGDPDVLDRGAIDREVESRLFERQLENVPLEELEALMPVRPRDLA